MNVYVDGGKLRQIREEKLIQRPELQELSGVSMSALVRAELGSGSVRLSTVKKLAGALKINPERLITGKAEPVGGRPPKVAT